MTAKAKKLSELERLKLIVELLQAYIMTVDVPEKKAIAAKLRELKE